MKRIKGQTIRVLLASLIAAGCWAIAPVTLTSCKTTVIPALSQKNTDQIILRAEQTAETARLTFNAFVHLERANEALLKQFNPQIHVYANTIRLHGLDWIDSLRTATKLFKANRTTANEANLNTWLTTLTNAVTQTQNYITESKKIALP